LAQRKSPKKTFKSNSNLPSEAKPGFFDETSLSHRKTMHILCIALRVYDRGPAARSFGNRWDEGDSGHSRKKMRVVESQLEIQTGSTSIRAAERLTEGQQMAIVPTILRT
jgi:hypothetical protein